MKDILLDRSEWFKQDEKFKKNNWFFSFAIVSVWLTISAALEAIFGKLPWTALIPVTILLMLVLFQLLPWLLPENLFFWQKVVTGTASFFGACWFIAYVL